MQQNKTREIEVTDSIVDTVIDKFVSRAKFGKNKYGTDLDRTDLSIIDWITHVQEELHDGILYLEKLKQTLSG
jgi:hypothetical protein